MSKEIHVAPTPSRRIWSSYEVAFVALVLFTLVGIAAGFAFIMMGVPMAGATRVEEAETATATESGPVELGDGLVRLAFLPPEIREGSGLVVSQAHEGLLWIHNDGPGVPRLYGMDMDGLVQTVVTVPGIQVSDFEDLGLGPCPNVVAAPAGTCLYLADTGDNNYNRSDYTVFAVAEPALEGASADAGLTGRLTYVYERGGAQDSEALAVAPDGRILVVTKGQAGGAELFALEGDGFEDAAGTPAARREARFLATLAIDVSNPDNRVTGAAVSPDGSLLAVRTGSAVYLFPMDQWEAAPLACSIGANEPQGEAVAFLDNTHLLLAGETGSSRLAPLLRLSCP